MSYDIYLEVDTGSPELAEVFQTNYTSNCAGMWRLAMPETDGLAGLHGMPASEAIRHLDEGLQRMNIDPNAYRALDPPNRWGDFEGQRQMLEEFRNACQRHPRSRVYISR